MANKTDFVLEVKALVEEVLSEKNVSLNKKEATDIVDGVLDTIVELTKEDGKLQLVGFGSFEVRERAARKGRNPQTGEEIEIQASKSPAFKPAKAFKDSVK